ARYPDARIDWLLTPDNAALVHHHPALSNVLLFDRRQHARFGRSWTATAGLLKMIHELWKTRYELVIDLHGQFRSALVTLASGAPFRIGFDRPVTSQRLTGLLQELTWRQHGWAGAREGAWVAYTHRIPVATLAIHAVDRYLWLTPMLGLDSGAPDFSIH